MEWIVDPSMIFTLDEWAHMANSAARSAYFAQFSGFGDDDEVCAMVDFKLSQQEAEAARVELEADI